METAAPIVIVVVFLAVTFLCVVCNRKDQQSDEQEQRLSDLANSSEALAQKESRSSRIRQLLVGQVIKDRKEKSEETDDNDDDDDDEEDSCCDVAVRFNQNVRELNESTCPICLAAYQDGEEVVKSRNTECQHIFHKECITDWLSRGKEGCPCCRKDYLESLRDLEKGEG